MLAALRLESHTLSSLLADQAVSQAQLDTDYGHGRALVRFMLGTVPHADPYLAVWPAAMRAQGLLVPAMLNLPGTLFGLGTPLSLAGLSMFAASQSAECSYCTAHSCTFAVRRGLSLEALAQAAGKGGNVLGEAELATLAVASGMSRPSPELDAHTVQALQAAVGPTRAEWLALAAGMMGYLNTLMDGLGVDLEESIEADVAPLLARSSWEPTTVRPDASPALPMTEDTVWGRLALVPHMPGVLTQTLEWTWRVPSSKRAVAQFLEQHTGHSFPLVGAIGPAKVRQALATVLRDHLAPDDRVVRGQVARAVGRILESPSLVAAGNALAGPTAQAPETDIRLRFAKAATPAAGAADPALLQELVRTHAPGEVVALVSWLGVLRMLRRLEVFYGVTASQ